MFGEKNEITVSIEKKKQKKSYDFFFFGGIRD